MRCVIPGGCGLALAKDRALVPDSECGNHVTTGSVFVCNLRVDQRLGLRQATFGVSRRWMAREAINASEW